MNTKPQACVIELVAGKLPSVHLSSCYGTNIHGCKPDMPHSVATSTTARLEIKPDKTLNHCGGYRLTIGLLVALMSSNIIDSWGLVTILMYAIKLFNRAGNAPG